MPLRRDPAQAGASTRPGTQPDAVVPNSGNSNTDILAGLSARFGTRFGLETVGECTTMVAKFEGGIEVRITDCGVTLSSVEAHLGGRANGYYVGVHSAAGSGGSRIDAFGQLGDAMDVDAPPTAEAIGDLVHQALAWAQFLREEETKSRGSQ